MGKSGNPKGRAKKGLVSGRLEQMDIQAIRRALMRWYVKHRRPLPWRETLDPYRIWVSEIMLQQTQVATVIAYYQRFLTAFPDIRTLARADLEAVLKLWEGLGYYARARNFHRAANLVVNDFGGKIPDDPAAFIALPGVGDYINAAVSSIAFGRPLAVVDGNVKRVLARLFEIQAPVNAAASYPMFKATAAELLDQNDPGAFNQAVMELGALVCKPSTPDCGGCPVNSWCRAFGHDRVGVFPVKLKKAPVPHHPMAVGVVFKGDRVIIVRRPEDAMLGGLWEFPGDRMRVKETAEAACVRILSEQLGLAVRVKSRLAQVRHAYTHFKITADVFVCAWVSGRVRRNGPTDHRWVALSELKKYPFPKSNHKFISELTKPRMPSNDKN